jgi:hypothetical protein
MNRILLGAVTISGKNFNFNTPHLSIYSTAAFGHLIEPEVEITISDTEHSRINPYLDGSFYDKDELNGEDIKVWDDDGNLTYVGVVSRYESRGGDLILYCHSPLAERMDRTIEVATSSLFPSDALFDVLVEAGLVDFIDAASFAAARAYYVLYPQYVVINTEDEEVRLVDIVDSLSKLCSVSISSNELGMIEFRVLIDYVPEPSVTIDRNKMLSEPTKNTDTEVFNIYQIQVSSSSNQLAYDEDIDSVYKYGKKKYEYSPSSGVYVGDMESANIFGVRKLAWNGEPLRHVSVVVKKDTLVSINDEVYLDYEGYTGDYLVTAKKYDDNATELSLLEIPTQRITNALAILTSTIDVGYSYGIYNSSTWGR